MQIWNNYNGKVNNDDGSDDEDEGDIDDDGDSLPITIRRMSNNIWKVYNHASVLLPYHWLSIQGILTDRITAAPKELKRSLLTISSRAQTNSDVFVLTKKDLDEVLSHYPQIRKKILETAEERQRMVAERAKAFAKKKEEDKKREEENKLKVLYGFVWSQFLLQEIIVR